MNILITGAAGFVGRVLAERLKNVAENSLVCHARRSVDEFTPAKNVQWFFTDVTADTNWEDALHGIDVVVHLAARAHKLKDSSADPLSEFRAINTAGCRQLALQAAAAGVRRFVFLSSIGVNGAVTSGRPFSANDTPAPCTPYAISKFEAETDLRAIAEASGMEVVVIRAPLVYGANAPGNFGKLMRAVQRGIILPLGMANKNARSFVAVENLVDLIVRCMDHPAAANRTFLVSDDHDLSTVTLINKMAAASGVPAQLIPVPLFMLKAMGNLLRKRHMVDQLCGDLQLDISMTKDLLHWIPPVSVDEGLERAVRVLK
jgi:nucleoside-diphosphate-sugar epimerase